MATPNPMAALPPPPPVSKQTIHMAGILVDVYGLAEVGDEITGITLLWLHHPRLRTKEDMADIAARAVAGWKAHQTAAAPAGRGPHAVVALAFDQRNHGTRLAAPRANEAWRQGNLTHAQDMFGVIAGTAADTQGLMDLAEGYLFPARPPPTLGHIVLGVSLGGHSAWQLMFADERVAAAVVVIGCPDFMGLLSDRARLSRLDTYAAGDDGASFLGSADFPPSLVEACRRSDPKAILFGTGRPSAADGSPGAHNARLRLEALKMAGKRFLVCSGADDKLVPYRCSEPFLAYLKKAAAAFPALNLTVRDNVYPGTGHIFSEQMVKDAVDFIVEAVSELHANPRSKPASTAPTSKW